MKPIPASIMLFALAPSVLHAQEKPAEGPAAKAKEHFDKGEFFRSRKDSQKNQVLSPRPGGAMPKNGKLRRPGSFF
jgi:hypothetical protein